MSYPFGDFIRALRGGRGLSQSALARRAGLAERTVVYWEAGSRLPRALELQSALDALDATPGEHRQAFALLRIPGSEPHIQPEEAAILLPETGSPAGLGDLLHALRKRRNWTQQRLASEAGVSRITVLRWETAQGVPSEEGLERACCVLGASPKETRGLRLWRTLPVSWKHQWTAEEYENEIARFRRQIYLGHDPLIDLAALTLKHRLRALAANTDEGLRTAALLETEHAAGLTMQERNSEARECLRRAIHLFGALRTPEEFWAGALNLASHHTFLATGSYLEGAKFLSKWRLTMAQMSSGKESMFLLCDMALYAAQGGRTAEARSLLGAAEAALRSTREDAHGYYLLTRARVRLRTEQSVESVEWLIEHEKSPTRRVAHLLMWTASLLAVGERAAASRYFARASAELTEDAPIALKQQFAQLANRF